MAANWRVIGWNAGINLLFYTRLVCATRRMSNVSNNETKNTINRRRVGGNGARKKWGFRGKTRTKGCQWQSLSFIIYYLFLLVFLSNFFVVFSISFPGLAVNFCCIFTIHFYLAIIQSFFKFHFSSPTAPPR